jgi:hypothetical protein
VSVRGAAPSTTGEAREALRQGKLPTKARLFARATERDFGWQLLAESMAVSGGSIPAVLATESDEAFIERLQLVNELEGIVHALYGVFLRQRLSDQWEQHVASTLRSWVLGQRVDTARYAKSLLHGNTRAASRTRASAARVAHAD